MRESQRAMLRHETLEQRALMAIDIFTQPANVGTPGGWVTIVANENDTVYAQQAATVPQSLLVADNASFIANQRIGAINSYASVFVTNGAKMQVTGLTNDGYPLISSTGGVAGTGTTLFVIPGNAFYNGRFDLPVNLTLSNGVGGRWSVTDQGSGNSLPLSLGGNMKDLNAGAGGSVGPKPLSVVFTDGNGGFNNEVFVTWDSNIIDPLTGFDPDSPPVIEFFSWDGGNGAAQVFNIPAASRGVSAFTLPSDIAVGELVAGSLSGTVVIPQYNVAFEFTTASQFGIDRNKLVFRRAGTGGAYLELVAFIGNRSNQAPAGFDRELSGFVNPVTGQISLITQEQASNVPVSLGQITVNASFARFDQPNTVDAGGNSLLPPGFTLFAGQTFSRALYVDLLAAGATATIDSPIINASTIDLRATNVRFEAPTSSQTDITVAASNYGVAYDFQSIGLSANYTSAAGGLVLRAQGNLTGYFNTNSPLAIQPTGGSVVIRRVIGITYDAISDESIITINSAVDDVSTTGAVAISSPITAETCVVNAAVAADYYDIVLDDDLNTLGQTRSMLFVSTTGSLGGALPLTAAAAVTPCDSVYVQVGRGDILVEGTISAASHTYIMQSAYNGVFGADLSGVDERAPYYFTTTSLLSGSETGVIAGGVVAVTMGNALPSLYADSQNGGSAAYNEVSLKTSITNLRIRAADQKGDPLKVPFPYRLTVNETDAISVDAVAASSLPIKIDSNGAMNFQATLASASDISLSAATALSLTAPLSTNFGTVGLTAASLNVANSVRVLDNFSSDEATDITLTATAGDLLLNGPVSAINRIVLSQSSPATKAGGTRGKVSGGRVVADSLSIDSTGSVALSTQLVSLDVNAVGDVAIDEVDRINAVVSTSGLVSLKASGVDKGVAGDFQDEQGNPIKDANGKELPIPALIASVSNASGLSLSSPAGSIWATVPTADVIVLGNKTNLAAKAPVAMAAAGFVRIRSSGGPIDVLDAPVAGRGAQEVRLVSTANLDGTFDYRVPGTYPSTLTATANGALEIDGVSPSLRDYVLLTGQNTKLQNGVYTVVDPGSPNTPWKLSRVATYDTTKELAPNSRFRVTDGTMRDQIWEVTKYDSKLNTSPVMVSAVPNRFGAFPVAAVTTAVLNATLTTGLTDTLTSNVNEALPSTAFDGVSLKVNDLVLVRLGNLKPGGVDTASSGVYQVSSLGGTGTRWKLDRVKPATFEIGAGVPVVVNQGTLRTRVTGLAYDVNYDSLGVDGLTFSDITQTTQTEIGTDNYSAAVTYVVSTASGTNDAAGSLGRMVLLSQYNTAKDPILAGEPQNAALRFANTLGGQIRLTQQLPQITRKISVDATAARYPLGAAAGGLIVIEGAGITRLRNGQAVVAKSVVNGFDIVGSGASGTVIAGLGMNGFSRGAAVMIDGTNTQVDDARVSNMTLGVDTLGRRGTNKVGIGVEGKVGGYTTLSGNTVSSSTVAGIQINDTLPTGGVRLVGNIVGRPRFDNRVGIVVSGGQNLIGLAPAGGTALTTFATATGNYNKLKLPKNYTGLGSLYEGLAVSSDAFADVTDDDTKARLATIEAISKPDDDGIVTVTITGNTIPANASQFVVNFGVFGKFTLQSNTIELPNGASLKELYLGQLLIASSLPAGTTITGISTDNVTGVTTITLSNAAVATATQAVTFGTAARNLLNSNLISGLELKGGDNRVVATEVVNTVFDGIVVSGGTQRIGFEGRIGSGGRSTAKDLVFGLSNAIYANGQYGIRATNAAVTQEKLTIQGNFLGANANTGAAFPNKKGNIVGLTNTQPMWTALAGTVAAPVAPAFKIDFVFGDPADPAKITGGMLTIGGPGTGFNHGLISGRQIWITSVMPVGSVPITVKQVATVTFTDKETLTAKLSAADATKWKTSLGVNPPNGTLAIQLFGFYQDGGKTVSYLSSTGNLDFEGNLQGSAVASTGAGGGVIGGGAPPVIPTSGRPIIIPPVRRR